MKWILFALVIGGIIASLYFIKINKVTISKDKSGLPYDVLYYRTILGGYKMHEMGIGRSQTYSITKEQYYEDIKLFD